MKFTTLDGTPASWMGFKGEPMIGDFEGESKVTTHSVGDGCEPAHLSDEEKQRIEQELSSAGVAEVRGTLVEIERSPDGWGRMVPVEKQRSQGRGRNRW